MVSPNLNPRTGYVTFSPYKVCLLCHLRATEANGFCTRSKVGRHEWKVELRENIPLRSGWGLLLRMSWDALFGRRPKT